jgi:hypothetical protein
MAAGRLGWRCQLQLERKSWRCNMANTIQNRNNSAIVTVMSLMSLGRLMAFNGGSFMAFDTPGPPRRETPWTCVPSERLASRAGKSTLTLIRILLEGPPDADARRAGRIISQISSHLVMITINSFRAYKTTQSSQIFSFLFKNLKNSLKRFIF